MFLCSDAFISELCALERGNHTCDKAVWYIFSHFCDKSLVVHLNEWFVLSLETLLEGNMAWLGNVNVIIAH